MGEQEPPFTPRPMIIVQKGSDRLLIMSDMYRFSLGWDGHSIGPCEFIHSLFQGGGFTSYR